MDFFAYANIAHNFLNTDTWYIKYIVGGLCFLIVFVFQAVGLFIISGREGYKHRWMAFVPFFNTYYIGVCGQKNRLFKNVDTKIFALVAAILEALLVVGYVLDDIAWMYLKAYDLIEYVDKTTGYGIIFQEEGISESIRQFPELFWAGWCFGVLKYILNAMSLALIVMQVFTLSAFFQTFAAKRYMLFTITSILFPIQGILIFILRNNGGMNYREYLRKEQERQYRMYQQYRQQQNFDQNPYNQNPYSRNPYNDSGYNGAGSGCGNAANVGATDDPFSEFGGNGNDNDPFEN